MQAFRSGFIAAIEVRYQDVLQDAQTQQNRMRAKAPSPFGSALLKGCIESAKHMADGGARFNLYGVNMHGLGTTVDSLHAVDHVVFRRHERTLAEIADAVAGDFDDELLRQQLRSVAGRYGTDHPETNQAAAWLSERVARLVLSSRLPGGVRPYPGFFRWLAEVWDHTHATPDGRRCAEHLSYGAGPAPTTRAAPTAVLASAQHVAHRLCACGNPLELNLPTSDIHGERGMQRLSALITAYFRAGGCHLHVNTVSADEMREAQVNPEQHQNLQVRISGFSAEFVTLGQDLQDVMIGRAEHGI
jgi:formate C-acetyltransferase